LTYDDQIALALELTKHPKIGRQIREKSFRVILDEAQDTDPRQFSLLLELARPPAAAGDWLETKIDPPRPGHFCMVGDFQQSIYRDPADLNQYRELHRTLISTGAAEELRFSVTFRLDQAQLDFVNDTFPKILNNAEGQVEFVELSPRAEILPGQVIRFDLGDDIDASQTETRRAQIEAQRSAKWIRDAGLQKLRARCWREVAILCPRKAWLRAIRDALLEQQIPVEVQSESDRQAEHPAYAWLTAVLAIMVDPNASYEIVGVLREVFGLSDDELARFADDLDVRRGGLRHAIRFFEREPSSRMAIVDIAGVTDPQSALDELARVCPPFVPVVVVGDNTDINFYRLLITSNHQHNERSHRSKSDPLLKRRLLFRMTYSHWISIHLYHQHPQPQSHRTLRH